MTDKNYENPNATVRIKTPTEKALEESAQKLTATYNTTSPSPSIRSDVERRITEQLILHWHQRRNGKLFPTLKEFDTEALKEIWDDCILIRIDGNNADDVFYEHIGLKAMCISGKTDDTEHSLLFIKEHLSSNYSTILEHKRPHVEESELYDEQEQLIRYRQILLPLGNQEDEITHILAGLRYKLFDHTSS